MLEHLPEQPRAAQAARLAALVDGEAYFAAVRASILRARRRIIIAAWDLHSRILLQRGGADDGHPRELGALLIHQLAREPDLQVFILLWDYAPIYALEREPLFFGHDPWEGHPRLYFRKDSAHPLAASQHQKLVAVDGRIAYNGGFDLGQWRWDTPAHRAEEPHRRDPKGAPYPPFHDVQLLVDGDAAEALEQLLITRWQRAGAGSGLAEACATGPATADPWPPGVEPLLRDIPVTIACTFPAHGDMPEVREVERLYRTQIAAARRFLYIENQYLTARVPVADLCRSLRRSDGPEIVILLPKQTGSWLQQRTMDVIRARRLASLRRADRHGRLKVYCPEVPGLVEGTPMVHAKLLIADDRILRVGSANLSDRSMGLDSECDLSVKARDAAEQSAIAALRHRLLAPWLGLTPAEVERQEAAMWEQDRKQDGEQGRGLIATIEQLRARLTDGSAPHLVALDGRVDPDWQRQMPDERLVDPDRPLDPARVTSLIAEDPEATPVRRRLTAALGILALFLTLAALWRWTPLGSWLNPRTLATATASMQGTLWGPPLATLGFALASLLAVPVTLLILASALLFDPLTGMLVSLTGATLSAATGRELGAWLGRGLLERLAGPSVSRIAHRLGQRGLLTILTVRIVPVAPFAVLNLVAGVLPLRWRDYLLGTLIGMLPGILALTVFAEGLIAVLGRADPRALALLLVGVLALGGLFWVGRRVLASASENEKEKGD
ncbi:Major cardiolipin synthase ClsA [Thiorhodovibrio winogradskyi]|uniref:Major cardiolipin synthase ClsA n=1 Tax=Thiorhodovibrio winogradskyi TaxID=77007 RepID=A0ABZ0S529_9GAMM|nr:VTT domain-containing protein [Thiorhodovibrio winogradskyi]